MAMAAAVSPRWSLRCSKIGLDLRLVHAIARAPSHGPPARTRASSRVHAPARGCTRACPREYRCHVRRGRQVPMDQTRIKARRSLIVLRRYWRHTNVQRSDAEVEHARDGDRRCKKERRRRGIFAALIVFASPFQLRLAALAPNPPGFSSKIVTPGPLRFFPAWAAPDAVGMHVLYALACVVDRLTHTPAAKDRSTQPCDLRTSAQSQRQPPRLARAASHRLRPLKRASILPIHSPDRDAGRLDGLRRVLRDQLRPAAA